MNRLNPHVMLNPKHNVIQLSGLMYEVFTHLKYKGDEVKSGIRSSLGLMQPSGSYK